MMNRNEDPTPEDASTEKDIVQESSSDDRVQNGPSDNQPNDSQSTHSDKKKLAPSTSNDAESSHAETNDSNITEPNESGKTPVYVIIVGIVLTLLVIVCLQVNDWSRDLTTNYAETDNNAQDVDLRPLDSSLDPVALGDLVENTMKKADRWSFVKKEERDDGSVVIDLIHKTLIFRFKDDVRVTITPTKTGSILNATSQSRVGKGDLGQNPKNIKELISRVRENSKG